MIIRNWTRPCENFHAALEATAERTGISKKEVQKIVLSYLFKCKQLIMQGFKIRIPGIIKIGTYYWQLKKTRRFTRSYREMKRRYGHTDYFKKSISKTKKI